MNIKNIAIKTFIQEVMSDEKLATIFCNIPASKAHHHSHKDGLIEHSVECVNIVMRLMPESSDKRDIAITAALFHDIGKAYYDYGESVSRTSKMLTHHDSVTLNLLYNPLINLRKDWPDAEASLIHCWTWRQIPYLRNPMSEEAEMVRVAEQISVFQDNHRRGFEGVENWKNITSIFEHKGKRMLCRVRTHRY